MKTVEISEESYALLVRLAKEDMRKSMSAADMVEFFIGAFDRARHERDKKPGRFPCLRPNCFELSEQDDDRAIEASS